MLIYLALGSNVGDRVQNISNSIALLDSKITNIKTAQSYESKPVGFVDQNNFINTVIRGETELPPEELLIFIKEIEKSIGRIERFKWGPREIDIDIIFYDSIEINTTNLTIPHPRYLERDFVLLPLIDLDENILDPIKKKSIKNIYESMNDQDASIIRKI